MVGAPVRRRQVAYGHGVNIERKEIQKSANTRNKDDELRYIASTR
jgi:hypothetical protein